MTLESGQVLAARYALLRKLGDGRTAEVWLARDREARIDRVLKILVQDAAAAADERAQFMRGARLQRDIDHPNVLRCTDLHEGEITFAVFANGPFTDLSRLRGADVQQLVPLLMQVATGVAALHARGLVHRDLKTTNVLVDDDGRPMLTDFGLAAVIGDPAAAVGGSPFTSSPQQLSGCAPAIADDVYSFGALAYELVSGYPPFYPDAEAARVATEAPAAPAGRANAPSALHELVRRCLARRPEERPRDMTEVLDLLRAVPLSRLESAPGHADAARVVLRAPDALPPAIEPQWQRPSAAGPSASELRSQGFRRGLLAGSFVFLMLVAGFVFFALPRWVERRSPATEAPAPALPSKRAPAEPAAPEANLQQLAEQKRQFEELRPVVVRRLSALEGRAAAAWGGDPFARGQQRLTEAEAASGKRDYPAALAALHEADKELQATEQRAQATLHAAVAAGLAAIESGDAAEARRQFELALKIDPSNAAARHGLRRVETLGDVRRLLAEAAEFERNGNGQAAEKSYHKALELDPDTVAARSALARLQAQATGDAFSAAVADGLAALSRKDYAAARGAYERAGRIRPGAPEVKEGLDQVERALGDRSIGTHLEAAQKAEREERWSEALAEYRKALAIDANLLAAQQGVERTDPRALLDAELSSYLERPERVFSSEVRGAARATIARAAAVPNPGPVLTRQLSELRNLLAEAETPVRVAIASDNQTEVTIYRVGKLGVFERKDMELLPGRYTVVGTRAGFRDVRREFTIMPGRDPPALVIRCEEQI
jgi:tetratricopeptide (TPR) repeat protein